MIKIKNNGVEQVITRRKPLFLFLSIFAFLMATSSLFEFSDGIYIEEPFDYFGVAFLCFWSFIVYAMSFFALLSFSKTVTVSDEGVSMTDLFITKKMKWDEIIDYGLSYDGTDRSGTKNYTLYFANEEQRQKNNQRKRITRKAIRLDIFEDDCLAIKNVLIPLCKQYTNVQPFPAELFAE